MLETRQRYSQLNPRARFHSTVWQKKYIISPLIGSVLVCSLSPFSTHLKANNNKHRRSLREMASLNLFISPVVIPQRRRVSTAATAAKSSGGGAEEKGILDWILGGLQKEDQLLETDPILKKVEDKSGGSTTVSSRRSSVVVPQPKKKNGGFGLGSLFNKSED